MKHELANIYRELAAGRLSEPAALARIKALKRFDPGAAQALLWATPAWEDAPRATTRADAGEGAPALVVMYGLPAVDAGDLQRALTATQCLSIGRAQPDDPAQAYAGLALACFGAVRELLVSKPARSSLIQLVIADSADAVLFEGLSGLLATARLENPQIRGQIVFVPAGIDAAALASLLRAEARGEPEALVRFDGERRQARRWRVLDEAALPLADAAGEGSVFKERGVYLITGGLGGLGRLFAREILARCASARLVLCGRSAPDQAGEAWLDSLRRDGAQVEYRIADVAEPEQAQALIARIVAAHGALNGIVHSAGLVRDDFLLKKTAQRFAQVLAPKVAGSYHLDLASAGIALDFFWMFSSIASWSGNLGQADYAVANGFMEAFALRRNADVAAGRRAGETLAIAWPHWLDGGMNIDAASMQALQQRTGLRSLSTGDGMGALYRALAARPGRVMALAGDALALRRALNGDDATAATAVSAVTSPAPPAHPPGNGAAAPVAGGDLAARTGEFLRAQFSAVLKIPAERIDPRAPLEKYGIDSILAMNLTQQLEASFGTLAKTLLFEYLSIEELTGYFLRSHADTLARLFAVAAPVATVPVASVPPASAASAASAAVPARLGGRRSRLPTMAATPAASRALDDEPIAIVGLSGRYPGSWDLDAFWTNLRDGRDCIVEVPAQRWDWREHYSEDKTAEGAHYSKWGGFIDGVDEFDPRFFNIAPREAHGIDPQERLFLQHAWMAVEDAGYTRAALQIDSGAGQPGQVGVYAGVMYGEYNLSGSLASIANRVSYFLNLHGPSLTLDTMCSSSLTAIHLACQDLKLRRTALALAGGVNVSVHPNKYRMLSGGQFISSDGHCQSFGEGGDGYIPGEGVGVAVLKRLSDAQRDGNHIYGVIRGSALNHGGKTNGYTVPNPQAQADAIRRALDGAGIAPRQVSYIEAHGTGTKLGDPIEIAALTRAFHGDAPVGADDRGYCLIGSAKSNIGHCESAAGIAGLSKVLLQMRHRAVAPSLHSARLNPHIDFAATPFVVNQTLLDWPAPSIDGHPGTRIAGISSFGAGGSNAHVLIEEYSEPARQYADDASPVLVPLSARTPEQLHQRANDLLQALQRGAAMPLAAVAHTLQAGREAMEERVAFVVESLDGLIGDLRGFVEARPGIGHRGQVKAHREELLAFSQHDEARVSAWIAQRDLHSLAQWWAKGLELDWRALRPAGPAPRLLSLPAYPFARERYWIDPVARSAPTPALAPAASVLHPLLHANTSSLSRHSYTSRFRGNEAFLDGARDLPALLSLEMLRVAVEQAAPAPAESGFWEFQRSAWGERLDVGAGIDVVTAVFARDDDRIDIEIYSDAGDGSERVHCQSHAVFVRQPAPPRLDIARLEASLRWSDRTAHAGIARWLQAPGQCLIELDPATANDPAWGVSPIATNAISAGLRQLLGAPAEPVSLQTLRIVFAAPDLRWISIRQAGDGGFDIDLCDGHGAVCAQLLGLHCEAAAIAPRAVAVADLPVAATPAAPLPAQAQPASEPREILLPAPMVVVAVALDTPAISAPASLNKPTAVALASSVPLALTSHPAKAQISLSALTASHATERALAGSSPVRLFDLGAGVFRIELRDAQLQPAIGSLLQALQRVRAEDSAKVVLLGSREGVVWRGDRAAVDAAIEQGLFAAIANFACPVLAVADAGASGAGLLLAAACDFMFAAEQADYGYTDPDSNLWPSAAEHAFFAERLGDALTGHLLYRSPRCSGAQLRRHGWACRIAPQAQVRAQAQEFAGQLAHKPRLALELLKTHLGAATAARIGALRPVGIEADIAGEGSQTVFIDLEGDDAPADAATLIDRLRAAASDAQRDRCGSVLLAGAIPRWLDAIDEATALALRDCLLRLPLPVICALDGDADGRAWWLGLCCDAMVYSSHRRYGVQALCESAPLAAWAQPRLSQSLGEALALRLSLSGERWLGSELHARAPGLIRAEPGQARAEGLRLADLWNVWPQPVLRERLQAQRALAASAPDGDETVEADEAASAAVLPASPSPIALDCEVVSMTAYPDGVVAIAMHDREARNMFSPALVAGLKQAFAHIAANPAYKAVVLSGYDSYFATGGTRDTLLAIQDGTTRFTDETVFQAPMDCAIPVIAAVQGHGIGGGWSFAMFADLVLLSEESRYLSPYMGYGFTPGAGSTLVMPRKLGLDLARESLMASQEISGRELHERGAPVPVLPRRDVVASALQLAARIAARPGAVSRAIKRRSLAPLLAARAQVYQHELRMHEQTFVGNAGTLQHIQAKFGDDAAAPVAPVATAAVPAAASVTDKLRQMLAEELLLRAQEIEDDAPFIDLGLDSITGVTWIRKINAHYRIDIEATKVYSHPTLMALSRYVATVAGADADAAVAQATPAATPVLAPVGVSEPASAGADDGAALAAVISVLRELLAKELHLRSDEIDETAQFIDLGLDSITGVTWVRKINERYRVEIEATKVYSHPTLARIGAYVLEQARAAGSAPSAPAVATTVAPLPVPMPATSPQPSATASARVPLRSWRGDAVKPARTPPIAPVATATAATQPIAVIGVAGQFAQARDLGQFWDNLIEGRDCIGEIDERRWSLSRYFREGAPSPGRSYSKWLGGLDEYDTFDPLFFNISPTEAECMDPQQRVFLQACWHGIENAGYDAQTLSGSQCGVFVGCGPSDYHQGSDEQRLSAQGFTGAATSILAARIAYFLNLRGPCLSIDTACSSSLVAIANACDSLNAGQSDVALAGGVYVMAGASMHIMTSQAGMLSADGRCYSFDQRANGFVPGEGVGVLMLKRLADAQRDGDRIQALIQGWGINQDGRSNGITAPNEDAQTQLLQSVYRRFGIDPSGIGLIEAHGTGTKLGDPIEVSALKAAFKPFTRRAGYCALGSVKSNIGHCLTAAGAAGVIKLILALKHRQLPPSANFQRHNEHIQLDGSPFYINRQARAWEVAAGEPRRGAVSSFGFSGTNAHLVLAEYLDSHATAQPVEPIGENGRWMVPLSARTEAQLRDKARDLLAFLRDPRRAQAPVRLFDLAYTLQTGREAMGERLGVMAESLDALALALDAYLAGDGERAGVCQGQVKKHREGMKLISQDEDMRATIVEKWLGQRKLSKLLDLWSKGLELDWTLLYGAAKPRRIELPNYPFAKQRYWLSAAPPAGNGIDDAGGAPALAAPAWMPLPAPVAVPVQRADSISYVHRWVPQDAPASAPATAYAQVLILVTGACQGLEQTIAEHHRRQPGCEVVLIRLGEDTRALSPRQWQCGRDDADGLRACLHGHERIDALYFLAASEPGFDPAAARSLRDSQESNEIQLLRLVKCLKHDGKIGASIDTYVLTVDNHGMNGAPSNYWGAGAAGLGYSLAQGHHQFRVRNLDLSACDLSDEDGRRAVLAAIAREPASDRGERFKLHAGRRHRHSFLRLDWGDGAPQAFKHGGVYVIVGGSGIVGRIITRQLIARYRARVVWIGRGAVDSPRVMEAMTAVEDSAAHLSYAQADALDEAALRAAVAAIKRDHGRIDGAIFSGMVFGADDSIDLIGEADFRSIMQVKTLGGRAFHAALRDESLDFLCYFSSGQAYAFSGAAKLSAYATGIAFGDAFVRAVRPSTGFPVGTINWGFWKAAVTERIEKLDRVSTRSLDALDDAEGFDCFERFIGELQQGRLDQVLCMRASREVEALMNCDPARTVALTGGAQAAPVELREDALGIDAARIERLIQTQAGHGLEGWFARLLRCQLKPMIAAAGTGADTVQALQRACGMQDKYLPWLRESLDMLARHGLIDGFDGGVPRWSAADDDAVWGQWRAQRQRFIDDPETRALAVLIEECLEQLPDILQGRVLATDVIFPNASMDKVAGLYRDNATADTFNEIVANAVASYLRQRLERDPGFRLRILEVGAGTGGTSAIVFDKLKPYQASIEQYCYTDLSKAFFFHAQRNYLPQHPYIVCQRLDIEQPIQAQGIEPGSFDLVIATNALHATQDIRQTLRHAKSALRKDGYLIVSEMSDKSLSTHLTFGLLDGWWLFQDAELRIPGCPGLYPQTWKRVLQEEGYGSVLLPGHSAQALGNQVVMARSDGAVLRESGAVADTVAPREPAPARVAAPAAPIAASAARDVATHVRDSIVQCLSATLKIPADEVETDIAFSDYGIDSILGVNFIEQINARFGIGLNTAIIFEYSSVERLSRHVIDRHGAQIEAALAASASTQPAPAVAPAHAAPRPIAAPRAVPASTAGAPAAIAGAHAGAEIAIIGMSGKFPKAGSVREFWDNLIQGVDGVEELPADYLDVARDFSDTKRKGKTRCKWGGVLAERDCFDPLFFSISPKEAESMNPHQRLVMQESWNAIEDAGYNPKALSGSQTGIFIGAEPAGYIGDSFTGLSDAIIASRLSYALNFNGPAFVVNTGCSSSAVAIHLACESLRNGESSLVLAGGVNACMHRDILVRLDEIEMLSPSGRCFTFDRAGDGTIISEGVGMIVLKRLDDAIADGDPIHATIRGSGMNQDGASNGITAPNGAAQEQLILSVYERFGIDPEQISYVEAHGTGTKLGDPVETNALVRAYRKHSDRIGWCAVGSAKSHIGHAAAAAGVIGVIKVLLSMRHRRLPKLLNFRELNPLIEFDGSPFYITRQAQEWRSDDGAPRMAAINSFGHSGTNVHLVLREHIAAPAPAIATGGDPRGMVAVPLSAKNAEQLHDKCRELLAFIQAEADAIDLDRLAYTLQCGREAMEERIGVVVDSVAQLAQRLRAVVEGEAGIEGVYRGVARRGAAAALDGGESESECAQRWVAGAAVDWAARWDAAARPARMSLPGYPFAKERYWKSSAFGGAPVDALPQAAAARPPARTDSIEDILSRIDDDALHADEGVKLLKLIV